MNQRELYRQLIQTISMFENEKRKMHLPELDRDAISHGLRNSRNVCAQPEEVVATPWMKNLLIAFGDIHQQKGKNGDLTHTRVEVGKATKAVDWINRVVNAGLRKLNGPEQHEYPTDIPISSRKLYDIDCWNGWKSEIWDIVPGQAREVAEGFRNFGNPHTNMSVSDVCKLLKEHPAYMESVYQYYLQWPSVKASANILQISDPFMSKGTGVSYPFYANDRTEYSPGKSYGKYTIELVQAENKKGVRALCNYALANNVYTGYARWQRGKGRPLIAQSRLTNLVVNTVNAPEMEAIKLNPSLNAAFVNESQLLAYLSQIGDWVLAHKGSDVYNMDYSKWDQNLGAGWVALQDAVRYLKAADDRTRAIILVRYLCNAKGYLVDGPANRVRTIYGRMTSGYDDTTLGNTSDNIIMSRGTMITLNPKHVSEYTIPLGGRDVTCVGDDILIVGAKRFEEYFAKCSNQLTRTVIHEDEKHARGVMFIQYRAFKDNSGKWVMAYNWPRVLRSMLSKENSKQLGRAGWTLSAYQQLGKLTMVPDACKIVCNIVAAMDQYHLSLDIPVGKLIEMVQKEDQERGKTDAQNRRKPTTAERLYNSNPTIPGINIQSDGKAVLDGNYFNGIQKILKSLYDPNYLPKFLGIANPDLSKVLAES